MQKKFHSVSFLLSSMSLVCVSLLLSCLRVPPPPVCMHASLFCPQILFLTVHVFLAGCLHVHALVPAYLHTLQLYNPIYLPLCCPSLTFHLTVPCSVSLSSSLCIYPSLLFSDSILSLSHISLFPCTLPSNSSF